MRLDVGDVILLDVTAARELLGARVANDDLQPGDVVLVQRHPDMREVLCVGHVVVRKAERDDVGDMLRGGAVPQALTTEALAALSSACACGPSQRPFNGKKCLRCLRPLA